MAGRTDKRAGNDPPHVPIPELDIFSQNFFPLHPSGNIREQDMRTPSNFDSNFDATL